MAKAAKDQPAVWPDHVRRQWGAEKPRPPLPAIPPRPSDRRMWLGGLAIVVTIVAWLSYIVWTVVKQFVDEGLHTMRFILEALSYAGVMTFLTFSALMYLVARQGAMYRMRRHVRTPRAEIDAYFAATAPSLTVLVPSYRETALVARTTLLSAALQEYPDIRAVLLIDDPPNPSDPEAARSLADCRAIPAELTEFLREPRERFERALVSREEVATDYRSNSPTHIRALADEFAWAANWLHEATLASQRRDIAEAFVADYVFGGLAEDFEVTELALRNAAAQGADVPVERITQLYRRLAWTFRAEFDSFERKLYASLSHEANKAMNLNSYIGLMGQRFRPTDTPVGIVLEPDPQGSFVVPDSDFVLTLDADSVLLPEYCLRLVHFMGQPGNERVAVTQTPYSAFRGARTRLERIAGATTDIQHILHQGMTYFEATFWVGANAVIRKSALDDIVEISYEGGREIRTYVQDRTVIEDTESSIDLVARGWSLHNMPERLSYSATPEDFGALAIQRARWANGGLLILPKFMDYVRQCRRNRTPILWGHIALRVNYMASITFATFGLIFLLVFPYSKNLLSPIILFAALPWFVCLSADLHSLGYKRTDVFRVYGFNLILLAVNLGGVLKSLQQAATKSKIPFARTPKVKDRTAAPAMYIVSAYFIAAFSAWTFYKQLLVNHVSNALFAAVNGVLASYAIIAFIGIRNSIVDVTLGFLNWVRVPVEPKPAKVAAASAEQPAADWQDVLFFGATQTGPTQQHLRPELGSAARPIVMVKPSQRPPRPAVVPPAGVADRADRAS